MNHTPGSSVFDLIDKHEQVVFCADPESGLRAIIAIYSTALGPGLGGTRFHPYSSEVDALRDVLALSQGMAYKAALAGLDLGGAKAVIIGDPRRDKSEALLRAYGRFVQSLNGRYLTAADVGTFSEDMDVVARECAFVTGRTVANGGAGDSSVLTAFGVYQGMRAAAQVAWGEPSLKGRRVGVAGVGKVGRKLVDILLDDGADVAISDVHAPAVEAVRDAHPDVEVLPDSRALAASELDVYAPCALGGAIDADVVERLHARVVCGAANNQLAEPGLDERLSAREVVYAPDFCVNSGGLIQVADELEGFSFERAKARAVGIYDTTLAVLTAAAAEGITANEAAERRAEARMAEVGRLRGVWLPGA